MMTRMFSFITHTWNPVAGGPCPYGCGYCWARAMIEGRGFENLKKKYGGSWRVHEPAINKKFKPGDFVFLCDMIDIGNPDIPESVIDEVFSAIIDQPEVKFLILTKSDQFYMDYLHDIPSNCVCGITMETDCSIKADISRAPSPIHRLDGLVWLKCHYPHMETFISIEPVMKFSDAFARRIEKAEPWAVAVGYDGYNHHLPEPSLRKIRSLISELTDFTTVYLKTIREAWGQ